MPKADGMVVIDTEINSKGFQAGTKELEASARRMANSLDQLGTKAKIALQKQVDSFAKLNNQYAQQSKKVDELRQKVAEYESQKMPTQEYAEIQQQIDSAQSKMDKLIEKQRKFVELGGNTNSKTYKSMQYDIEELANTIKYANGELEDLVDSGKAFTFGANTEAAQKDIQRLAQEEQKLQDMNNRLGTSYDSIKQKVSDYQKELLKTDESQKKTAKSGEDMNKSTKKASSGIGRMLATSILFSFVFQAISAIMNGATEGMNNLAQYSNSTNATLSSLMSSLTQLKNAFATAFSPILTAVAPAINYLINLLTAAVTAVAQLFSALTGKSTYVKAIKVQQDYAASLKDTGSAASSAGKDAKKAIAPFDDLVQIQQQGSEAGGGGGGGGEISPSEMFEEVAVSDSLISALDKIKDIWKEFSTLFAQGFDVGFVNKDAIEDIKSNLESIKQSLINIFTSPEVIAAAANFRQVFAYNLGVIAGSVASIGTTIAQNITGGIALYLQGAQETIKQYIVSMFDISSDIMTIVGNFSAAFANIFSVFGEENGQKLTASLIGMFTSAFMGVTELSAKYGRDILDAMLTPIVENQEQFRAAFDGILQVASSVFETLYELTEDTFGKMNEVYDTHIAPMFNAFRDGFTTIYNTALNAFNEYILPVLQKGAQRFDVFKDQHLQPLINKFIDLGGNVADIITTIWNQYLSPFLNWCIATFSPGVGQGLDAVIQSFFAVLSAVSEVVENVLDILNSVLSFINNVFKGDWEAAWEDVKEIFRGVFNGIIGIVESAINFIVRGLNRLLSGLSDIADAVGDVIGIDINIPKIKEVNLPRLASGTVIPPRSGEFAAILGDNNHETEVVSPVSAIKQALLEAMEEYNGGEGQNITINFGGSMAALARALKPELDREASRRGTNLVIVGGR